jgi:glutamine amidotransferase-like uncharacterized protein
MRILAALAFLIGFAGAAQARTAIVYDGPTICDGCADPFVKELRRRGFVVRVLKTHAEIAPALSGQPAVFVIPGGEDAHVRAENWDRRAVAAIRAFVQRGGTFVGVCLGAYWAADWNGEMRKGEGRFEPLGLVDAHVTAHTPGRRADRYVTLNWQGQTRKVYYQDGPQFSLRPGAAARVLATYGNGEAAALLSRFGRGRVALSGAHVEADRSWIEGTRLRYQPTDDLFRGFMDAALDAGTATAQSDEVGTP